MVSDLDLNRTNETSYKESKKDRMHPHKFTMWIAIASIIMMFAGLTSAFIVKSNKENWVTVDIPKIFWVSTAVLFLSSLVMHFAVRSFKQREMSKYQLFLALSLLLGIAFLLLQWKGFNLLWNDEHVTFKGGGAGQFLYVIFGLHLVHVLGGVVALLVIFLKRFFGRIKNYNVVPVEVMATYWYFIDFLWIYLLIFFIVIN